MKQSTPNILFRTWMALAVWGVLLAARPGQAEDAFSLVYTVTDADGTLTVSPLAVAADGTLFGATAMGGDNGTGSIFSLKLPHAT